MRANRVLVWSALVMAAVLVLSGTRSASADVIIPTRRTASPAEDLFQQGLAALGRQDLAAAEQAFRAGVEKDPKLVGGLLGLAEIARRRNQASVFGDYMERAYRLAPDSPEVQVNWARYQVSLKRNDRAEEALKAAIKLDPALAVTYVDLGELYAGTNRPKEAEAQFRAALQRDPNHAGAHFGLALVVLRAGDTGTAEKELLEASRLAPQNPRPLEELAGLYARLKQYDKAKATLDKLIAQSPSLAPAYLARGDARLATGDEKGALEDFQQAGRVAPKSAQPLLRTAMLHQSRGRVDQAEAAYQQALKLDPKSTLALNNLAWMAAERRQRLDEALRWARQAVDLQPSNAEFLDTLGWVYRARGDLTNAAATLQKAATAASASPDVYYHFGIVLQEQGRKAQAVEQFEKALKAGSAFGNAEDARRRIAALK